MAYKSSMITRGRGSGVVVATGAATELGCMTELLRQQSHCKDTATDTPGTLRPLSCTVRAGHLRHRLRRRHAAGPAGSVDVSDRGESGSGRYSRSAAGGENARVGHVHLCRQNRDADLEPDVCRGLLCGR